MASQVLPTELVNGPPAGASGHSESNHWRITASQGVLADRTEQICGAPWKFEIYCDTSKTIVKANLKDFRPGCGFVLQEIALSVRNKPDSTTPRRLNVTDREA